MAGTERARLLAALEDLEEQELRCFKARLRDFPVERGYNQVPRGRLEGADALALCDLLLGFYGPDYALRLAAQVLDAAHGRPQAHRLREPLSPPQDPDTASVSPALHFIERHREELIRRTATVEGVLDLLYGTILDEEQYQRIASRATSQEKMRELYRLVPSWDWACKDRLYQALRAKNRFLIKDLEGR